MDICRKKSYCVINTVEKTNCNGNYEVSKTYLNYFHVYLRPTHAKRTFFCYHGFSQLRALFIHWIVLGKTVKSIRNHRASQSFPTFETQWLVDWAAGAWRRRLSLFAHVLSWKCGGRLAACWSVTRCNIFVILDGAVQWNMELARRK